MKLQLSDQQLSLLRLAINHWIETHPDPDANEEDIARLDEVDNQIVKEQERRREYYITDLQEQRWQAALNETKHLREYGTKWPGKED